MKFILFLSLFIYFQNFIFCQDRNTCAHLENFLRQDKLYEICMSGTNEEKFCTDIKNIVLIFKNDWANYYSLLLEKYVNCHHLVTEFTELGYFIIENVAPNLSIDTIIPLLIKSLDLICNVIKTEKLENLKNYCDHCKDKMAKNLPSVINLLTCNKY
ncbi:hypothetical protein A3Q56_01030 [Intoshia linei]|uniref:Saposin B-type domain-containing protein n=1 Tax=Intoshia linei TaxID=1819745 RepID=A0A177BAA7_9BILA|nr:hypothetical protein A3Q56_01030 [Intoshia linei]